MLIDVARRHAETAATSRSSTGSATASTPRRRRSRCAPPTPFNNPPVVFDAFGDGRVGDGHGRPSTCWRSTALRPRRAGRGPAGREGVDAPGRRRRRSTAARSRWRAATSRGSTRSGSRTPTVAPRPRSLYVPPIDSGCAVREARRADPGRPRRPVSEDLADYVVNPSGGPVQFTLKDRIWSSPETDVRARDHRRRHLRRRRRRAATPAPAAVIFEVTTGTSVDDPDGIRAVLSVPVQVGEDTPDPALPRRPDRDRRRTSRSTLDIASLCHVWTPTPGDRRGHLVRRRLARARSTGWPIIEPSGPSITVGADAGATPGIEATCWSASGDSEPSELQVRRDRGPAAVARPDPDRRPARPGSRAPSTWPATSGRA